MTKTIPQPSSGKKVDPATDTADRERRENLRYRWLEQVTGISDPELLAAIDDALRRVDFVELTLTFMIAEVSGKVSRESAEPTQ